MKKLCINHNEKGFTLIELMIVIAIIGILAAIAIPNFIAYRDKAYCSSAESDANAILSSMSDFYSIPTHITITTGGVAISNTGGEVTIDGTDKQIIPALSGNNSATIAGSVNSLYVMVQDASGRCPKSYRDAAPVGSSTVDGWTHGDVGSGTISYYYKGLR